MQICVRTIGPGIAAPLTVSRRRATASVNPRRSCFELSDDHDPLYTQKITFGEMRESGVRDVLIYCRDHRCSHHVETNADGWADDVRLSDIEPDFVCTACGKRGGRAADIFAYPHGYWLSTVPN
jgi:hypothetical protein